jgi:hypothetical protein
MIERKGIISNHTLTACSEKIARTLGEMHRVMVDQVFAFLRGFCDVCVFFSLSSLFLFLDFFELPRALVLVLEDFSVSV